LRAGFSTAASYFQMRFRQQLLAWCGSECLWPKAGSVALINGCASYRLKKAARTAPCTGSQWTERDWINTDAPGPGRSW
jgi:hypothetical protein